MILFIFLNYFIAEDHHEKKLKKYEIEIEDKTHTEKHDY